MKYDFFERWTHFGPHPYRHENGRWIKSNNSEYEYEYSLYRRKIENRKRIKTFIRNFIVSVFILSIFYFLI